MVLCPAVPNNRVDKKPQTKRIGCQENLLLLTCPVVRPSTKGSQMSVFHFNTFLRCTIDPQYATHTNVALLLTRQLATLVRSAAGDK
jgi:hypothetical protein